MKFSIVTPTYKRSDKLVRVVNSLLTQTYKDWELIIVNDSPHDNSYFTFVSTINDSRIRYYVNDRNRGVNYSRNFALTKTSADSRWIIFLDDDDYLAPDTLSTFISLIQNYPEQKWFVTNRALINGSPLTKFPKDEHLYNYALDYLIFKRCKGDATHCIETKTILQNKIIFSKHIKQGEEWLFFYQLGTITKLFYYDHNSTISDGYDTGNGLNFRKRSFTEQIKTISVLIYEGININLLTKPTFVLYLLLRVVRAIITRS